MLATRSMIKSIFPKLYLDISYTWDTGIDFQHNVSVKRLCFISWNSHCSGLGFWTLLQLNFTLLISRPSRFNRISTNCHKLTPIDYLNIQGVSNLWWQTIRGYRTYKINHFYPETIFDFNFDHKI
uniref:Uncharacterized protein n=1 Tax=Cacopsylla melanoneura TaxID=428564 RepID=A0A8D8TWI5_9HEMI